MANNIPSFQQYQLAFTAHIRDPINQPRPSQVAAKRMNVYAQIVFNNLFESVSACFPVAQKTIGARAWQKLVRDFFREYSANTPIFRKIPEEFLSYLSQENSVNTAKLPPYLFSLCHYEWVELFVSTMENTTLNATLKIKKTDDLLAHQPAFTPSLQLLKYEYAVQKISLKYKPNTKEDTYLLVYRNSEFAVKFIEINAVTHRLIELLIHNNITCEQALTLIAGELNSGNDATIVEFGLQILTSLQSQGVILGVYAKSI